MGGCHILCQILNSLGLTYGLEDEVQFPEWPLDFILQKNVQTVFGAQPASYSMDTTGIKQLAGELENSPTSSAEVKNEWSYTPP